MKRSPKARLGRVLAVLALLAGLTPAGGTACGGDPPAASDASRGGQTSAAEAAATQGEPGDPEGTVRIPPEVQGRFGITTTEVVAGAVEEIVELPGEIVPDPDRIAHVSAPFAGTVEKVFKHVGDRVEAGEPLAVIRSAQALAPYTLEAGIAGTLTSEHAAVGEAVDGSHELFTIADTAVVWVQLQVFPSDLDRVEVGDPVEVLRPGAEVGARGEISFVNPMLGHDTRSALARVELENDGAYRPGLFVSGRVVAGRESAELTIPTSALVREEEGWSVFVRAEGEPDRFSRRPVKIGRRGLGRAEVLEGLKAGEKVVDRGAFLVKSAASRGELGGGH